MRPPIDVPRLRQDLKIINRKCDIMADFINSRKRITPVTRVELIMQVASIKGLVAQLLFTVEDKERAN